MATIIQLQRAAMCSRYDPQAYLDLCRALVEHGDQRYARDVFLRWAHADPGNPMIAFYQGMLLGGLAPERMPVDCVRHEFDEFAPSFDMVLARLQYRVPSMLAIRLARHLRLDANCRTADLGCGTGLTGQVAKPYSAYLVGVDLSAGMLGIAKERGIYDELVEADLCDFLGSSTAHFDLVVAGDSLVYLGDLLPLFRTVHSTMTGNGMLLFSLELAELDSPYTLGATGRFAHSESALRDWLAACNFKVLSLEFEVLRMESGRAVDGMLVVAQAQE
jgi:predicted TPR repeat methyltransferase